MFILLPARTPPILMNPFQERKVLSRVDAWPMHGKAPSCSFHPDARRLLPLAVPAVLAVCSNGLKGQVQKVLCTCRKLQITSQPSRWNGPIRPSPHGGATRFSIKTFAQALPPSRITLPRVRTHLRNIEIPGCSSGQVVLDSEEFAKLHIQILT